MRSTVPPPSVARLRGLPLSLALWVVAALALAPVASAQQCQHTSLCGYDQCASPASPVPASLWGTLKPVDTAIPRLRDISSFTDITGQYATQSNWYYMSLDIANNMAVTAMDYGLETWDVSSGLPNLLGTFPYTSLGFFKNGEDKTPINDVKFPPGSSTMVAMSGTTNTGMMIFDVSSPAAPKLAYQNYYSSGAGVMTLTVGTTHYAFMSSTGDAGLGLLAYNMDAALAAMTAQHGAGCTEDTPGGNPACRGVYVGKITNSAPPYLGGVDHYLVTSGPGDVEIWDVTNPAAAIQLTTLVHDRSPNGVAMWKGSDNQYYLGVRTVPNFATPPGTPRELMIFNVNCVTTSCVGIAPPLVGTYADTSGEVSTPSYFLTYSVSGGRPYLYLGDDEVCGATNIAQHEYLLDVSNPVAPHDITPPSNASGGYWGHYYRNNPTGFNYVMPRRGKFNGQYFYRAAQSLFDVHQMVGATAPTAAFVWSPQQIYPNTPVTFTDQSGGQPTSWSWTFSPDGTPATSTAQSPTGVTFATAGNKTVSLTAHNSLGSNTSNQTVNVLSATPVIANVTVSPAAPLQCQPVTFTGNGVTGEPPLTFGWAITNSDGPVSGGTSTTNPFTWDTKANAVPAGNYTATLVVSGQGRATAQAPFTLAALPSIPLTFTPSNDSFSSGTVQFHLVAAGATQWNWNFGDGSGYQGLTTDPVNGPNPTFTYKSIGQFNVTVQVGNCLNPGPFTSSVLQVNVSQITPLTANFAVLGCNFGICAFSANQAISFADSSTGAVTYDYDWTGSGTFTELGDTHPATSHTYSAVGQYSPILRVHRGVELATFQLGSPIVITSPTPPHIGVSGPTSGVTATPYVFSAASSGCTPAATWSWNTGGGSVSGSSTGSSITLSWAGAGLFTVTATNSGCSGTSGSVSINISSSTGGGTLGAVIHLSPSSPTVGSPVSFDGTLSTGSPTGYSWFFGDGGTAQTSTASHTYTTPGLYTVKLDVSAPGASCLLGICTNEATQQIQVAPTNVPPPPPTLNASFTSSTSCSAFAPVICQGATAQQVTLTSPETHATSWAWNFGDGTTGTGKTVTHTWTAPQDYTVTLTVAATGYTGGASEVEFDVVGPPPPPTQTVLLPWISETRGALVQSSDLYVHNPDTNPVDVTMTFRKRGTPDVNPPQVTKTIEPGATFFAPDVLSNTFSEPNVAGFISLSAKTFTPPILTVYNTTSQASSPLFGQTVAGVTLPLANNTTQNDSAPSNPVQELIGLNVNGTQLSTLGITNPNASTASYHLSFFDNDGNKIGDSGATNLTLGAFGQRQFQTKDLATLFNVGISDTDDYRVEVDTVSDGQIIPFGSNISDGTGNRSYIDSSTGANSKVYLIGVFNNAAWQSDVVLANTSSAAVASTLSFVRFGVNGRPAPSVSILLAAGASQRLVNPVGGNFHAANTAGVMTINSTSNGNGLFPIVRAENYNNTSPAGQYRGAVGAFSDADAATVGQSQLLVGLRQDAENSTTMWLFNPSSGPADYDVIYRNLDGSIIRTDTGIQIPGGRLRQYLPAQLRLGASGVQDGFTVQIVVKQGSVLSAAQVVSNATQAPAYLRGVTR